MPPKKDESPIESLQQTLDTPDTDVSGSFARTGFHREARDVPPEWTTAPAEGVTAPPLVRMKLTSKHHTLARWMFGAALIFFLVALGVALYFLTGNRNVLSTDKIDIVVTGPSTISAGEVVPLAIEIRNNNASTLEVADLLVEYPPGTRSADDVTDELLRTRVGLGDLAPGSRVSTTSKAIVFGEAGSTHDIVVSLEYRIAGSNAIFVKERAFTVEISDSPVSLSIDTPSTINSGDDIKLVLTVRSNSTVPVENVVVKGEYPFGFEFTSSDPEPSFSESVWSLGVLKPGEERTMTLRGKLEGQNDEERIFRFELGVGGRGGDVTNIGTSFARVEQTVTIARPFVDIDMSIGGDTDGVSAVGTGKGVDVEIGWRNNLTSKLSNATVQLEITGNGFNEGALSAGTGFYDSTKNTIVWDRRTTSSLALIDAGDSGRVSLGLSSLSLADLAGRVVNPVINLALVFRGTPVGDSGVPEQIKTDVGASIRVITDAVLEGSVHHRSGVITNDGSLPPRAESETTYTVTWEVSSSVNDITNAHVVAVLPPYVSWKDIFVPTDEDVSFDQATGKIDWSIGTVRAGAGYGDLPRTVSFKIGFIPSVTQVGTSPVVIKGATFSGVDGFTGARVSDSLSEQTTELKESGFHLGDGVVAD